MPDLKSVGVGNDKHYVRWLDIICVDNSSDVMTAIIKELLHRITVKIKGISRMLYYLTLSPVETIYPGPQTGFKKPPAVVQLLKRLQPAQ